MVERLENSLRVKIIGKCNRNCFFCHQEGGMDKIEEIYYTPELGAIINQLSDEYDIHTIAITGGEPLLHRDLKSLLYNISTKTKVNKFSLTTNGTIEKDFDFWEALKKVGLYKVNLSISDLLMSVKTTESLSGKTVYENQIETIRILNQLGIIPNVNIVVYNDKKYLVNLLNILFEEKTAKFKIALLPDLNNEHTFKYSKSIIDEVISHYNCSKVKASHRKGTSNTVCDYKTKDGIHIQVKTTKPTGTPKWLDTLCLNCEYREHCQEGFYGLRIEKRSGLLMIRLCLYKSDSDVLMTINDFFDSPVRRELKTIWK